MEKSEIDIMPEEEIAPSPDDQSERALKEEEEDNIHVEWAGYI